MSWYSSDRVSFGEYVWLMHDEDDAGLYPLAECLSYAINSYQPLDYFLGGLLTDDELALSGGDPGWSWYREKQPDGTYKYHAWTYSEISGLDPCEGEYDEATVKKYVRRTLENFRKAHPERAKEVEDVIAKYQL